MSFDSKKWWEEKLSLLIQSNNVIYPNGENELIVPSHEKKEDYYENLCFSHYQMNFTSKENGGKKAFQMKPKNQCLLSQ